MTLLKLCRCGKPIPIQQTMCDVCSNKQKSRHTLYDKHARNQDSKAFYHSKQWRVLSDQVYNDQHGLCQMCLEEKKITTGTYDSNGKFKRNIVDHIIPITVDWSKRLVKSNLWVLCQRHHNVKTAEDRKKYKGRGY